MKKVKGFAYDPIKDADVIEHIGKQPNQSQYIWSLVRKDMHQEEMNKDTIKRIIRKEIEKYLEELNLDVKQSVANIDTEAIMKIIDM